MQRHFIYLLLAVGLLTTLAQTPLRAQEPPPAPAPAPEPAATPKKDLPPLKLPAIPGEEGDDEDPDMEPTEENLDGKELPPPAPAPTPLPLPTGTPVIRPDLPTNQPRLFRIEYDGHLVGYSFFEVTGRMSLGGEAYYILKSKARLKLGVGALDDSNFASKLVVDTKSLNPSYFRADQKSKAGDFSVECVYSESLVAQKNRSGKNEQDHFFNYKDYVPRLLFNNLWGHLDTFPEHYWLLIRSAVKGGVVPAYDPILRGGGDLIVYPPKAETWTSGKQQLPTLVYRVSDMQGTLLALVRVHEKTLDLLEIEEVGRGLKMTRSGPEVIAQVDKQKGLDLLPRRLAVSNILFPDPEKLSAIEADIDISLRGGQFADHRIPGYRQYFSGELKEGLMKGRVFVRSVPRELAYKTKYPLRSEDKPPEDLARYLKPGPGVESDFPAMVNKALELTWKSDNTFVAARRLMNFVSQIEEGVSLPSARYAMESGVGNPESKSLLLVALARAAGLPARPVGGLLFRDGAFAPHHWVEIWLGPSEGWAPFDPTTVEAGRVGATHIALWESGDIQKMAINVINYAPRAPRKVAFFNRELNWTVGEERVYDILKEGKPVGQEVAAVRDMEIRNDREVYRFEATATLNNEEKPISLTSVLHLTPHGLPIDFELKGNQLIPETFRFENDTARLETPKPDGSTLSRDIPFSYGTYLTDQRFLSQWALVVGQSEDLKDPEKAPKPGDKLTFHVFVPEDMRSREMVLEVKEPEVITLEDGTEQELRRLETDGGMAFLVNDKNQVVKISVPQQQLDLVLKETHFKL